MRILDTTELISARKDFLESIESYIPFTVDAFNDLSLSGCRWIEIYGVFRWSFKTEEIIVLKPAKSGQNRYFKVRDISSSLVNMINSRIDYNDYFRYHKAQRIFNKFFPYPDLTNGNKQVSLHFFRYCYARELKYNGMRDKDISILMGETDQKNTDLYIYSVLTTTY